MSDRSVFSIWLAPAVVLSVVGLQLSARLPADSWLIAAAMLAVLSGLAACWAARTVPRASGLLALIAVAGFAWSSAGYRAADRLGERLPAALEGVDLTVRGVIDELPARLAHGQRFGAQRDASADAVPMLVPGQRWRFVVRLKRPHASNNPDAFDRELRWLEEGVGAIGSVRSGELIDEHVPSLMASIERARLAIRSAILLSCGREHAREGGVLAALAIGDQAAIDPDLWTMFNQTGVGHLMSISGLHITMLAGMGGSLASWIWRRRWAARRGLGCRVPVQVIRLIASVGVAFAYALLAGWGIPAQRTCFMLAMAALLLGSGRCASIGAAVGASAAVIALLDPWAPLSAGFWLSFGAVLAIVWVCAGTRFGLSRIATFVDSAVRTQWAATIALLPLGAWFFGSVSLIGPIANA